MKKKFKTQVFIGTSGWHYNHWLNIFYPPSIKGYYELRFHSEHFNTVENNSSFYRIASEATYKTWVRMTPDTYKFSMKLNQVITHTYRLKINPEVKEKIKHLLFTTQVLASRMGAIVIQLPPSLKYDINLLEKFLTYFTGEINKQEYQFDVAIEFRNKHWFNNEVYKVLKQFNVALVAAQSSRYPEVRQLTATFAYIRMHGPDKLFSSSYTDEQLEEWAGYVKSISKEVERVYIYFNNDFHGYALTNAKKIMTFISVKL